MFDITASLKAVETLFQESGHFRNVIIGEPKEPPDDMTIGIFMEDLENPYVTLNSSVEVYSMTARIYGGKNIFDQMETLELMLAAGVSKALNALAGSFTLGGTIRSIDWTGEAGGSKVGVKWGHVDIGGTMMRCADMHLSFIVDDAESFAP